MAISTTIQEPAFPPLPKEVPTPGFMMEKCLTLCVFPGQGSQHVGMGNDLFDDYRFLTEAASDLLGYSIKDLCLQDTNRVLDSTQYTQPALYVVNILHYLRELEVNDFEPDVVMGHSLGEYCALYAADVFNFEVGLKLVQRRGELMSKVSGGAMAAILGLESDTIINIIRDNQLDQIDIANYNSPLQTVISCQTEALDLMKALVKKAGGQFVPLKVSGAFHSRYMKVVAEDFSKSLQDIEFHSPNLPVIANITARPYKNNDVIKNLQGQLYQCVKWTESLWYLMSQANVSVKEIGPGAVLTRLVDETLKNGVPTSFNT